MNLEPLEERQLLAVFTVTNANNAGAGSLRQAILNANSTVAQDEIRFSIGSGPKDLIPTSPLPTITNPVLLNGATQPGYSGTPLITIMGQSAGPFSEGLILQGNDSVVRALTVRSFNGHGIVVYGNFNTIERCYIGIDPFQTFGAGNRDAGVAIENGSNNTLRGNVISGNGWSGVIITGTAARSNVVASSTGFLGNYIGTNATGTVAVPNGQHGVFIGNGAALNTIGGGPNRNVISGNTLAGVALVHNGTTNNAVWDNYLGTNLGGSAALGNGVGVLVAQGARFNRIGNTFSATRNIISGNRNEGIMLTDAGTSNNVVEGNIIGPNGAGLVAIPNQRDGVWIGNGASNNMIGGTIVAARNIISSNSRSGVILFHGNTRGNVVRGNYIGTNSVGNAALGNGTGVWLAQGVNQNTIGGSSAEERNVISANRVQGVMLRDNGTSNNVVLSNYIGTNAAGTAALGNSQGVRIALGARDNTVGGNLISSNQGEGVALTDVGTMRNLVQGNTIGTNAAGTAALGNSQGVRIALGASSNTIGGTTAATRNLISGNRAEGVAILGAGTMRNVVQGNYIGTDAAGNTTLGNLSHGVRIAQGAQDNAIGAPNGAGNVISGNAAAGVALAHSGTILNSVQGNTIGLNAAGTAALGNFDGVQVTEGANTNLIGGSAAGQGNVIAGNQRHGVVLWDAGTTGNLVRGNTIAANADSGVVIGNEASFNFIGGDAPGEPNVIAFNGNNGIGTVAAGRRNLLRGNAISENGALGIDIDSDGVTFAHTVWLTGVSSSGTDTTVEGWVIGAPNATYTVELFASAATDPSGFGEGEAPLPGLYTIGTDADGYGYLLVTLPFPLDGSFVSATVTASDGTTGEFGNSLAVVPGGGAPGAAGGAAARALSPAEASLTPPHPIPTSPPDAARALSPAASSRSALPALLPSREHPGAEGPTLRADGAPFRDHRPDGAAVDAFLQLVGDHDNVEDSRSRFRPLSTFDRGMDADIFAFLDFEEDVVHPAY